MRRWLERITAALVALLLLSYAVDVAWLAWRERYGGGHDMRLVDETEVMREKGDRMEFFANPPQLMPCVRTLYPHGGQPACWWLARHAEVQKTLN